MFDYFQLTVALSGKVIAKENDICEDYYGLLYFQRHFKLFLLWNHCQGLKIT